MSSVLTIADGRGGAAPTPTPAPATSTTTTTTTTTTPTPTTKKRTKASRACDQCRKKKIKCDYDDGRAVCTNCARNSEACTFERVPLKRGPSKGYHRNPAKRRANATSAAGSTADSAAGTPSATATSSSTPTAATAAAAGVVDPLTEATNQQLRAGGSLAALRVGAVPLGAVPMGTGPIGTTPLGTTPLGVLGAPPRTPSRSNSASVLLPPLAQVQGAPVPGGVGVGVMGVPPRAGSTSSAGTGTGTGTTTGVPALGLGQQQFWKVPYHEFSHQRKGSIDSMSSDISVRNTMHAGGAGAAEQFYVGGGAAAPPPPGSGAAANYNHSVGSGSGSTPGSNYWSFFKSGGGGTGGGTAATALPGASANNDDTQSERSRGSSLIPSILRQTSTAMILGQPQLPPPASSPSIQQQQQQQQQNPYSYFQFQQQQQQLQQQQMPQVAPAYNQSLNLFSQYASNGFQSRHNSITSEAMSPSSPAALYPGAGRASDATEMARSQLAHVYGATTTNTGAAQEHPPAEGSPARRQRGLGPGSREMSVTSIDSLLSRDDDDTGEGEGNGNGTARQRGSHPARAASVSASEKSAASAANGAAPKNAGAGTAGASATAATGSGPGPALHPNVIIYGQISDIELINIYYEFIHVGFPVIPLNKRTLTNDILLVNTQPISSIHELNNYVILWFRNSLELLVRIALKKESKNDHFFDNNFANLFEKSKSGQAPTDKSAGNAPMSSNASRQHRRRSSQMNGDDSSDIPSSEAFEVQSIFIAALNECFQKIVDIHPKFRENRDIISPKIKIIYLSTFLILNNILAYVGYDNTFVLGMSVTIFNEFKLYKLLVLPEGDGSNYASILRGSLRDSKPNGSIASSTAEDNNNNNSGNDRNAIIAKMENESLIVFKRLYIALVLIDAMQSCAFGGPKLLNIAVDDRLIDTTFRPPQGSDPEFYAKWCIDENSARKEIILENLKVSALLSQLSMNRVSLTNKDVSSQVDLAHLVWLPQSIRDNVAVWNNDNGQELFASHQGKNSELGEHGSALTTLPSLFSCVIQTKQCLISYLISLNDKNDPGFTMTLDMTEVICDLLCSILKKTLKILTLLRKVNATNSIDPTSRPMINPDDTPLRDSISTLPEETPDAAVNGHGQHVSSMGANAGTPAGGANSIRSITPVPGDFYQKLLGMEKTTHNMAEAHTGIISPFAIAMYHELHNVTNIIKQMPTVLIRLVMKISHTDNTKAQAQVVKLSNSLNEVVQIMSLLNLVRPFKMFESDSLKEKVILMDEEFSPNLNLKWRFIDRESNIYADVSPDSDEWIVLKFIDIGWKLLDDAELGWFH